jgi:Ca-activated chloride channel family protein
MQRWHLTAGLVGLVLAGALVAPRLSGKQGGDVPTPPTPPTPPLIPEVPEIPEVPPVPAASDSGHLTIDAGLDRTAVLSGEGNERFLTITVGAPEDIGTVQRRPVDLAVVMDVSGSMSARGKIDYAKRAAKDLATAMEPGDVYSLVTFSDDASVVIPATRVSDPTTIHHAIDRIYEGGGTNIYAGLVKGSEEVARQVHGENVGRIVLLSDGNANVGIIDPDSLARFAAQMAGKGIAVSTIGLGIDYNEDLLARIADIGGGSYDFVDDPRQLQAVFKDELERSASVVARSTQIEVKLPAGVDGIEVLGWEAERTADGWLVDVGEVYAGDTKKIVARVKVRPEATSGEITVASAVATYHDVIDDAPGRATDDATAKITREVAVVKASIDKEKASEAAKAWGNSYLDRSARAYQEGRIAEAQAIATEGQQYLEQSAFELGDDSLAKDADNLAVQNQNFGSYAPASEEGIVTIKAAKKSSRDAMR